MRRKISIVPRSSPLGKGQFGVDEEEHGGGRSTSLEQEREILKKHDAIGKRRSLSGKRRHMNGKKQERNGRRPGENRMFQTKHCGKNCCGTESRPRCVVAMRRGVARPSWIWQKGCQKTPLPSSGGDTVEKGVGLCHLGFGDPRGAACDCEKIRKSKKWMRRPHTRGSGMLNGVAQVIGKVEAVSVSHLQGCVMADSFVWAS